MTPDREALGGVIDPVKTDQFTGDPAAPRHPEDRAGERRVMAAFKEEARVEHPERMFSGAIHAASSERESLARRNSLHPISCITRRSAPG